MSAAGHDRIADDLMALARVPGPTFSEAARIEWLVQRLDGSPGSRSVDAVGNLIWRWEQGRPRVLIAAHVDNVFDADVPLDVRRVGDRIVGPGVGDNAAAIAVTLNVVGELLRTGHPAPGAVAFTVCEEGLGNLRGATAAIEALDPQQVVAVEGHMLDCVLVDAVGSVRAKVALTGPGGHPWADRGRPSPVHALLAVGSELVDSAPDDAVVNVGLVDGGQSVNSIASAASLVVECRSLKPEVLDAFIALLGDLAVEPPLEIRADVLGRRPAGRFPDDHPLLRVVLGVRKELGLPLLLEAGSTDANAALSAGIPALTVGVSRGGDMHTTSEWIEEGTLDLGREQLRRVLSRLLF